MLRCLTLGYLIRLLPHPRACFFKQTHLQCLLNNPFLEGSCFTAQVFYFFRVCCAGRVACQLPNLTGRKIMRFKKIPLDLVDQLKMFGLTTTQNHQNPKVHLVPAFGAMEINQYMSPVSPPSNGLWLRNRKHNSAQKRAIPPSIPSSIFTISTSNKR